MENNEKYFNMGLPKWPQMLVWGEKITIDQAMEIIIRTDNFFSWAGGNNKKYVNSLINKLKYPKEDYENNNWSEYYEEKEKFLDSIKYIETEYVNNSWISCSFVYGTHGWCHPDGTIGFIDNVGKYPSVEDIYNEWSTIAKEFPFLKLNITLMDGESCEYEYTSPVVTMNVCDGKVTFVNELLPNPYPSRSPVHFTNDIGINFEMRSENYFIEDYVVEWFEKVKGKYGK